MAPSGIPDLLGGDEVNDARITDTAPGAKSLIGNTPRRQSVIVCQGACAYGNGEARSGISIVGTGKSWGDDAHTIVLPAYRVLHGFRTYQISARVSAALSANNLFSAIAYSEIEGAQHGQHSDMHFESCGRCVARGLELTKFIVQEKMSWFARRKGVILL